MWFLVLKAFIALIQYDIFLVRYNFASLHAKVHLLHIACRKPEPGDVEMICEAVAYACIWYAKPVLCLQRSAVATILLRRNGVNAELVIGTLRLPLRAHAWVEVGGRVVNDKTDVQANYMVLDRC